MVLAPQATTLLTGGVVTTVINSNIIGTEYTMVTVTYTYPPTPATTTTVLTDAAAATSLASYASAAPSGETFPSWYRCASGEECYGKFEAVSSPFIPLTKLPVIGGGFFSDQCDNTIPLNSDCCAPTEDWTIEARPVANASWQFVAVEDQTTSPYMWGVCDTACSGGYWPGDPAGWGGEALRSAVSDPDLMYVEVPTGSPSGWLCDRWGVGLRS